MRAIIGGPGLLFRFMVAGMTAILVVFVMSMAVNFVVAGSSVAGAAGGDLTGSFIQTAPNTAFIFIAAEIVVGIITFLGSLFVLSKK